MRKIVFVFLVTLFPNLVFACAKDKVDIYKYVTDSKIAAAPILEGCLNINFLPAPKKIDKNGHPPVETLMGRLLHS
ncbi:hypothetical protein [Microbulbifer thermotolerans]|uniref:hypothetical protein n=1 Tax=Microbulbifer thermotolerans TaxID=252514 RepID=UPI000ACA3D6E|nr:hypothetical protein [Microbulbifer thermotolerans]